MFLKMLKGKIHRATVTGVDPDYEGSITIDEQIAQTAGIAEFECVLVADCNNGTRHETHVIYGPLCSNGSLESRACTRSYGTSRSWESASNPTV
jgi:aspartate 1-decarboxylase